LNATGKRRALAMVACALVVSLAAPLSSAVLAGATLPPPGSPVAAPSAQGRQQRIKVLTAALRTMHRTFSKHRFDTPGPQDTFDYQIGDLWKRDIDGFGTTVAVIEGQVAPPEMMRALEYVSSRRLANAISISDGTGESTYSHGREEITAQDPGELAAAAAGIPVMVATGDCGVVQNLAVASNQCGDTSAAPDTAAWDDSGWVTAVGGSVPNLSPAGRKIGPDPLWHVGRFSEGAGFSSVFPRPAYQNGVAGITGSRMRAVPDITMDAQDGTSEAAPLFAGVLALATQLNHADVGPVNPALYGILGPAGARAGITDVVKGNDSAPQVPGLTAARGFDVASGWGTINASRFVPSLVAATRAENQEAAARQQAAAQLSRITRGIQISPGVIPAGHEAYLLDQGFLPGRPVGLYIDNVLIRTLTASTSGYVTATISPSKLKLPPGNHVLQLRSMLFNATNTFTSG
jgi:hypothetical protein